jgi:hypothetical protein
MADHKVMLIHPDTTKAGDDHAFNMLTIHKALGLPDYIRRGFILRNYEIYMNRARFGGHLAERSTCMLPNTTKWVSTLTIDNEYYADWKRS